MGALQYMVVGYQRFPFEDEVLPELRRLSEDNVIRVLDILFVTRSPEGLVSSRELDEEIPDLKKVIVNPEDEEWLTEDDIELAGESLPTGSTVALMLFEHCWADKLEEAVMRANDFMEADSAVAPGLAMQIEQNLAIGGSRPR